MKEFINKLNSVHNIPFNNLFMSKNLLISVLLKIKIYGTVERNSKF
nr:MAG TPA: hypothetical protein [Crassvirales sp.]